MSVLHAAVLIPFDPNNQSYMVVRSTNWHPKPEFRHKLKAIGGLMEPGETIRACVFRELAEEHPGWFLPVPGTSKGFGDEGSKLAADGGLYEVSDPIQQNGICWHVTTAPTDLGQHSFFKARSVATESTPEVWSIGDIPPEDQCLPGFQQCIAVVHEAWRRAYARLRVPE